MSTPNQESESPHEIELYRTLAENACDLICQAGPTGRYLYASPNYEQVLGYRPDELIGQSIFSLVHPDDFVGVNSEFIKGVATRQPAQIQFRYRHKNGEWRWLETSGKPFFGWKGQWRATFVSRDITARRQMEEQLRREHDFLNCVLASTSNAIAALDCNGRLLMVNLRMQELTGRTEAELLEMNLAALLEGADRARIEEMLPGVIEKKQTLRSEINLLRHDGKEQQVRLSLSPLQVDGKIEGVVMTAEDLTDIHQVEKELEHLHDELEVSRKLETIGTLAAGVAHDFNNILSGLLLGTELLQSDLKGNLASSHLLKLQREALARATALTQQLLGFSRQTVQEMGRSVDLASRVKGMLEFCATQLDPHIHVKNELPAHLPPIRGNPGQIDQLLLNLFLNAGQALAPKVEQKKEADLIVSARLVPITDSMATTYGIKPGTEMLRFSVSDTGVGIAPDVLPKIFQPFFTTNAARGNHGLGLATVSKIVQNHGGAPEVESVEGVGTSFHIYLPLATAEDKPQKPPSAQSPSSTSTVSLAAPISAPMSSKSSV